MLPMIKFGTEVDADIAKWEESCGKENQTGHLDTPTHHALRSGRVTFQAPRVFQTNYEQTISANTFAFELEYIPVP